MNSQACGSNALQRKIVFSQKRIEYNQYISRQENLKGFYYEEKNRDLTQAGRQRDDGGY